MGRIYTELGCGCLISCMGGGGLILSGGDVCLQGNDCKISEYTSKHRMEHGRCVICH